MEIYLPVHMTRSVLKLINQDINTYIMPLVLPKY